MKALFRKVHGKGKVLMMWIAPGSFDEQSGKYRQPAIIVSVRSNGQKANFALTLQEAAELQSKLFLALNSMSKQDVELLTKRDEWARKRAAERRMQSENMEPVETYEL